MRLNYRIQINNLQKYTKIIYFVRVKTHFHQFYSIKEFKHVNLSKLHIRIREGLREKGCLRF
jgi:hypothetical protein